MAKAKNGNSWDYMFGKRGKQKEPPAPPSVIVVESIDEDMIYERLREGFYESKLDWKADHDAHRKDTYRLQNLFEEQALEAVGLKDSPNAKLIWSKAWEHGHSAGLHEVWIHVVEFAEFVKEITCPHCNNGGKSQ